jgi:alkylation response protein AidB-like acyl-CoA dehydrogenase
VRRDDAGPEAGVLARHPPLGLDRGSAEAAQQVAHLVRRLCTGWVLPAAAPVLDTWRALAGLGRDDLAVGRLVEGHVDALWILKEAGREAVPGAVYGVWASASGGTGLTATDTSDGWSVDGTMRYCSGAWFVDRALVVVSTAHGKRLIDVDVRAEQLPGGSLTRDDDTWPAVGMDVTRSVDVAVRGLAVRSDDAIGGPDFYLDRPGFAAGGVGVAAVWLGGAAGVLDALIRTLSPNPGGASPSRVTAHQRAHLGAMAATVTAADALLAELAHRLDRSHPADRRLPAADAGVARAAVELAVEEVLQRAARVSGPTPLCRDAAFGHRLADLQVYVRQHHAEADYEQLGERLLESGELLGRRFG